MTNLRSLISSCLYYFFKKCLFYLFIYWSWVLWDLTISSADAPDSRSVGILGRAEPINQCSCVLGPCSPPRGCGQSPGQAGSDSSPSDSGMGRQNGTRNDFCIEHAEAVSQLNFQASMLKFKKPSRGLSDKG